MPIKLKIDENGPYYQWGNQAKYYFKENDYKTQIEAYNKAARQARAIYANR
jgi:hypothetical protein